MSTDGLVARARQALRTTWGFHRPPHAFVLTQDRLVRVSLPREARGVRPIGGASVTSRDLPPGTFREGPAGLPVAGPGLGQAISSLLLPKDRLTAASLAVPDGFVKAATVDLEPGAQKRPKELGEMLRWKVSRLYGEPAPELRITWCEAGAAPDGGIRLLVLASPEETIVSLETAFQAHGIRIGALEPAALAMSAIASLALAGTGLVVFTEGPNVSTVFLEKGAVRFLRTRETAADPDQALQEIRLAAAFVGGASAEGSGLDLAGDVVVVPDSAPASVRLREFLQENGGKEPLSLLPALRTLGFPHWGEDTAPLVGVGLLQGVG